MVEVVGKAAHKLAREQGFRTEFRRGSRWRQDSVSAKFRYSRPDVHYRVHPDDQAAFIARNTPKPVAPKVRGVIVWQGYLINSNGELEPLYAGSRDHFVMGGKVYVESKCMDLVKGFPNVSYVMLNLRITAKGAEVLERVDIH